MMEMNLEVLCNRQQNWMEKDSSHHNQPLDEVGWRQHKAINYAINYCGLVML